MFKVVIGATVLLLVVVYLVGVLSTEKTIKFFKENM